MKQQINIEPYSDIISDMVPDHPAQFKITFTPEGHGRTQIIGAKKEIGRFLLKNKCFQGIKIIESLYLKEDSQNGTNDPFFGVNGYAHECEALPAGTFYGWETGENVEFLAFPELSGSKLLY